AQNPVFVFEDGIVNEFAPAKQGRKIIEEEFISEFKLALSQLEKDQNIVNFEIPLATTEPEYTSDEANRLGIKELLGKGTSKFSGSATSRIHNIGVATAKFHGLLLEPGETMSFNEILGDVSTYSGYQQAY